MYLIRIPKIVQRLCKDAFLWQVSSPKKAFFLTFDDGPTPELTPFILQTLAKYKAQATFFCVGENAHQHPNLMADIIAQGHSVGQHTYNHLNGWHTPTPAYVSNVKKAHTHIASTLFRPPYGRIKRKQARLLSKEYTIVMWSVLSGDFDPKISPQQCLNNLKRSQKGDIIVMHDNIKAKDKIYECLPLFLQEYTQKGYTFLGL